MTSTFVITGPLPYAVVTLIVVLLQWTDLRFEWTAASHRPGLTRGSRRILLGRLELERDGVHAVPQAGWPGTVVEDVAQMAAAARAEHLGPGVAEAVVFTGRYVILRNGRPEARPPCAGIELGVGAKQLVAAGRAAVDALAEEVMVLAGEGPLGVFLPQDGVLLRRKQAAPLGL